MHIIIFWINTNKKNYNDYPDTAPNNKQYELHTWIIEIL